MIISVKKLLIVYHGQSGHTEALAAAVLRGARRESGTESRSKGAFEADLQDLLWCDAVIFGTPENFGYMSGAVKDFFDRTYYPALPYELNLPYAQFVSAGNDGSGAVRHMDRILRGYPMRKIAEALIVRGEIGDDDLLRAEELGETVASGLAFGIF